MKNTVAIASGKGGVGKSTVAVNLAMALVQEGARVGLLDCDIYGPSVPKMTGTVDVTPEPGDGKLLPVERYGLSLMSIGYLVPPGQSVVWRGPLIHRAVQQFLTDVDWGELDYLLIDLPPGTGDAQLSLSQTIPLTGVVLVTTPQEIALIDVRKGADMFAKVNVPVLGVVENMSYFLPPGSDARIAIFGCGGGKKVADELSVPLLGELPIEVEVREGGDKGVPSVVSHPDSASSRAFREAARALAARISLLNLGLRPADLDIWGTTLLSQRLAPCRSSRGVGIGSYPTVQAEDLAGLHVRQDRALSVGPADLHLLRRLGVAEAEVRAQVMCEA